MKRFSGLFFLLLIAVMSPAAHAYDVRLTQADLQQRIDENLPISQGNALFQFHIPALTVALLGDSRQVALDADIHLNVLQQWQGKAKTRIRGGLEYVARTGTFYLHEPNLDRLDISHIPEQYLKQVKSFLKVALSKKMTAIPLYRLDKNDIQQRMTQNALKDIKIEEDAIVLQMEFF